MASEEGNVVEFRLNEGDLEGRVDAFLGRSLQGYSRVSIQRMIQAGYCKINGQPCKASDTVKLGDLVQLLLKPIMPEPSPLVESKPVPLDILFEDQDILVINKPPGLVVHPGAGSKQPTLVEGVLSYLKTTAEHLPGNQDRPGIVHRLDKDTSGVMVICKSLLAHESLAKQFREKTNLREYVALLNGYMNQEEKVVESYLTRDERHRMRYRSVSMEEYKQIQAEGTQPSKKMRFAKTIFYRRKTFNQRLTLALIQLTTGRTHQIRVHARSLKLAVWGDPLYGLDQNLPNPFSEETRLALRGIRRQLLHARRLGFMHPRTQELLAFEAPVPADFKQVLEILNRNGTN